MDRKVATQFQRMRVQVNEPRPAFDMYIAVWSNPPYGECVIGAPSVEQLELRWARITHTTLDADRAQHVLVIHCDDAPDSLMREAKAKPGCLLTL